MERVWLHNEATGGDFYCPADAVEAWRELGWEPGDPPAEVNLAVAERIEWERQQAQEHAVAEKAAKPKTEAATGGDKES